MNPNLVGNLFGNNFFDPNYGTYLENNYFLVRTKLGYLRYVISNHKWGDIICKTSKVFGI